MKLTKAGLTVLVVVGMIAVVLGVKMSVTAQTLPVVKPVVTGRTFGVTDARVKIQEFTDFQCPACANARR